MRVLLFPSPHPQIHCLLQSLHAAPGLAEGAAPAGVLSAEERAQYEGFRVPKRRRDWLLGRWTAKNLVRAYLTAGGRPTQLDGIVIIANPDGSPYATVAGARLPLSLSISHSGESSFCALTPLAGTTVGADVEMIEPRPVSLAEQFFTQEELAGVLAQSEDERDFLITLVWSAKEAFLKCMRQGLRVDTRAVTVRIWEALSDEEGWQMLEVVADADLLRAGSVYQAWWRREGRSVLTLGILREHTR